MRPVRNRLVLLIALCLLCCCIPFSKSFAATIDGVTYTVNYGRLAKVSGGTPGAALVVPATIGGVTFTSIENYAFEGTQFGSIVLPDTVTCLGYGCFRNCTQLTSVQLPSNLQELWGCAFWGCTSLESIVIPDSVTLFGESVFYSCTSLKSVKLPASITKLPRATFLDCASLTDVKLPKALTAFDEECFYGCSSLETFVVPEGITTLPTYLFLGCSSLKSVTLPSTLKSIGFGVFENCTSLTDITLPEGLKSIGEWAFYDCTALPEIHFPQRLETIGDNAFFRCHSLQTVTVPEGIAAIGPGTFADCTNLTDVYLHKGVTSFLPSAVDGSLKVTITLSSKCPSLKSIINAAIPCRLLETGQTYNMIAYVDPSQHAISNGLKVQAIIQGLIRDGMSDYEKVLILNNWVMRNVRYVIHDDSPHNVLFYGTGNCAAITSAFSWMLTNIGIEHTTEEGFMHIWNMIRLDGEWYHLDVTWNATTRSWDYFCVSNYALEPVEDHECYYKPHVSTAYQYNYAYRNGQLDQRIAECQAIIEEKLAAGETAFSFIPASFTANGIHNRTAILALRDKVFTLNGDRVQFRILYDHESRTVSVSQPRPAMSTPDAVLPGQLIHIENESFRGAAFRIVYLHNGVESIGDYAFADCTALREIRIPATVNSIAETAFEQVENLCIFGYAESPAQQFAAQHGHDFVLLE